MTGEPEDRPSGGAGEAPDSGLLERWALGYLEHYASSAENLRRILLRRVRRHYPTGETAAQAVPRIDALVARYVAVGLIDDAAYAVARAQARQRRGEPLGKIRAGLSAKGVAAPAAAAALQSLHEATVDPDLAAACAFARRRRLGPYRAGPADGRRDLLAFARAGFDRRAAEAVLACADIAAVEALARGGERD